MNSLLNLKTTIPVSDNRLVKRKRLFDILDENLAGSCNFLLVSAPAGYGKTTLVAEWLKGKKNLKAWFSVDETVSSPVSFFTGIIAALQKVNSNFGTGTANILKMPELPGVDSVVASFIEEIKLIDNELILVIDDLQLIDDDFVYDFLQKFIRFLPENVFLITLTREDPPLMLNRYRVEGIMNEIREKDLRFNIQEMMELFNKVMNLNIEQSNIKDIYIKSEGWISGAKLVGLKLIEKDRTHTHDFITSFSGSHYYIIDYLMEEVLREIDEDLKEFLYKTSIVEKFCPELCNCLTGRDDSLYLIKELEKMNMFLKSLDHDKKWFRYHQLFRDSLKVNLTPSIKKDLHIRASNWFASKGLFQDAVHEALLAEEYELAVEHITTALPGYLERGELNVLLELLEKTPDEFLSENGLLLIMKAWLLFVIGRKKDALYYVNIIEKNPGLVDKENRGRLLTLTSLLPEINQNDDPCIMAEEALELIDDNDKIFKINALMSLGQIQAQFARVQESVESFRRAYYLGREAGQVFMEIMSLINLALKLNQMGNLREALTLCEQNINRLENDRGYLEPLARLIYIPLGILHYFAAEFKKAGDELVKGIEISEQLNLVHVSWMPKIYYAMSSFEIGKTDLANEIIDDTLDFASKYNLKPNYQWAENIKNEFILRSGNLEIGKEKLESYKDKCSGKLSMLTVKNLLTYCRLLLNNGNDKQVIKYLKRLEEYNGDHVDKITTNLLLSGAYYNCGDKEQARTYFFKGIKMSGDEGYIGPFVREANSISSLLNDYRELAPDMIDKIKDRLHLQLGKEGDKQEIEGVSKELVETLTEREEQIIELVADGLTNKRIAEQLFITEGTTKWHLSNIYSKLGVKNRTRAVAKVRELGLIG